MNHHTNDLYGIMGDPVAHSKSPEIHSLFALQTTQNIRYELIHVTAESLENEINEFKNKGGKGLNITLPHKTKVINFIDEITERARVAGAVNTLILKNNKIYGDNTDGIGLMNDLMNNYKLKITNSKILILGAGGASRGIIQPLLKANPTSITIANRTLFRAEELADHFNSIGKISTFQIDNIPETEKYDLIINATSAETINLNRTFKINNINDSTFCYDLSYGRKLSAFNRFCLEEGASLSVNGWGMLIEQAAESFYLWRGIRPTTNGILQKLQQSS